MKWYAHSAEGMPEKQWQPLADHLHQVANLASQKASHFNADHFAEIAGLLHDLGKYTREFQERLRGSPKKVSHSTHGALIALEYFSSNPIAGLLVAYCIAGHHAGLADRRVGMNQKITDLQQRLESQSLPKLHAEWQQEIKLSGKHPLPLKIKGTATQVAFQLSVFGRMLYSCLVDADFLDTEAFYQRIENRPSRDDRYPSLHELRACLDQYLSQDRFKSDQGINKTRHHILKTVRQQAVSPPGLFSLNVPTGGGKTLASLAFALDHAVQHQQRRVILVIPFTSIVEQNAQVWRAALGDLGNKAVLEHHSAFNAELHQAANPSSKDKLRQAAENWQAPIVVTTAVQFFESLFANRSSHCRKLHNIANAVVILDEVQTLPTKLLRPCVAMIKELALNYHTSLVMCTATQPALGKHDGFKEGFESIVELAPEPVKLHQALQRVTLEYIGECSDQQLIEELAKQHQVLCIVNNRRHARYLFEQIREIEGSAHLTTLMCAQHRSEKLEAIRRRLGTGQPVRLISTSLIEAGVDVDFPCVYRAEAGLDSIAQAAGRCNREAKRPILGSQVKIFRPDPKWPIPPEIAQFAAAFRSIQRKYSNNLMSLEAMADYFKEVYWLKDDAGLDAQAILSCAHLNLQDPNSLDISYEQMAQRFNMIENSMQPVIVPYIGQSAASLKQLLNTLEYGDKVGAVARKLQRYLVQVPEQGLKALMAYGAVRPIQSDKFGQQFLVLDEQFNLYDQECGLSWDDNHFLQSEALIIS